MKSVKAKNKKLDLNLLQVFDVIYNSKSLTQASYSLGITQPAVSNALTRIRKTFDDKLFIRSSAGMMPTPLAIEIAPVIKQTLSTLEGVFNRSFDFSPEKCTKTFSLAMTDYGATVILPKLMQKMAIMAPLASIKINRLDQNLVSDHLAIGVIDIALGSDINVNADIYAKRLYKDKFVCMVKGGHSEINGEITMDNFVSHPHILFTPQQGEWGIVTDLLSKQGLRHKTTVYTTHAYSIPGTILVTDFITTIPERLASAFSVMGEFQVLKPPISIPELEMNQFWHVRTANDPPNIWLRQEIVDIFKSERG